MAVSRPVILAVDPGLNSSGWAIVELDPDDGGRPLRRCGTVKEHVDLRIGTAELQVRNIFRELQKLIVPCEVATVFLERPAGGKSWAGTNDISFLAGSMAQAASRAFDVAAHSYYPQEWKGLAGIRSTPIDPETKRTQIKGRALFDWALSNAPAEVAEAMAERSKRPAKPLILWRALELGFTPDSDDAADAACMAYGAQVELQRASEREAVTA